MHTKLTLVTAIASLLIANAAYADKPFKTEVWKSVHLSVSSYHETGANLDGCIRTIGKQKSTIVIQIFYVTDKLINTFVEASKGSLNEIEAYGYALVTFTGELDWVQTSETDAGNAVYHRNGTTAILSPDSKSISVIDDDWFSQQDQSTVLSFVRDVTAWSLN